MKKWIFAITGALIISVFSCELLEDVEDGLSTEEVVEGLKTALEIGTDTATSVLGLSGGYLDDLTVKIPLPDEAVAVQNLIKSNSTLNSVATSIGLHDKFDNVVIAVNHAAEKAAKEAAPIFKKSITNLTVEEGWDILNGIVPGGDQVSYITDLLKSSDDFDSTAATKYFKNETFDPLVGLYSPKIDTALDQDIEGLNITAYEAWNSLTSTYNTFLSNAVVQTTLTTAAFLGSPINLPGEINTDIGEFCTIKALNGLFLKVGNEEKKIRKDPYKWAVDIIQKVFGSILEE